MTLCTELLALLPDTAAMVARYVPVTVARDAEFFEGESHADTLKACRAIYADYLRRADIHERLALPNFRPFSYRDFLRNVVKTKRNAIRSARHEAQLAEERRLRDIAIGPARARLENEIRLLDMEDCYDRSNRNQRARIAAELAELEAKEPTFRERLQRYAPTEIDLGVYAYPLPSINNIGA